MHPKHGMYKNILFIKNMFRLIVKFTLLFTCALRLRIIYSACIHSLLCIYTHSVNTLSAGRLPVPLINIRWFYYGETCEPTTSVCSVCFKDVSLGDRLLCLYDNMAASYNRTTRTYIGELMEYLTPNLVKKIGQNGNSTTRVSFLSQSHVTQTAELYSP